MDSRQLSTFRTIATLGSFNKAAEVLDYAQSTVSEQIKSLEADLNVVLFDRGGKRVSLTKAGELFLQYAQKLMDLEEEARTEVKDNAGFHGSLALRIPETVSTHYLPPVLGKFRERFPTVDLNLNSCSSYGLPQELRSGIMDLAFLITSSFDDPDLEVMDLIDVPLGIFTGRGNPLSSAKSVGIPQLKKEPVFATTSDCNYFGILERMFAEERSRFSCVYRVNSVEAIKRNVAAGNGVALLPHIAVQKEVGDGGLVELPFDRAPVRAKMVMIRLKGKWHPPMLEEFVKVVKVVIPGAGG